MMDAEAYSGFKVRIATLDDVDVIVEFGCRQAFDTEKMTLDKSVIRPAVAKRISTPKLSCYLLAYDENDPEKRSVGNLMICYEMNME